MTLHQNIPMCADLAQQRKQNEQIRKGCALQCKTMALQRAAMELQREAVKREVKKQSAASVHG